MAKSKLSPDYIEWVLKLNADQAAREMHKLNEENKENKELSRQQNAARQAMGKLEAEGKKGSKEWQNLKKKGTVLLMLKIRLLFFNDSSMSRICTKHLGERALPLFAPLGAFRCP